MSRLFQYSGDALKTYEVVTADFARIQINKIYRYKDAFYFCINSKGYLHILKPEKHKLDGTSFFFLVDYRLTKDNKLQEIASSVYNSIDEIKADMEDENKDE